jgi:O-antigen/teichoic acid export membrane protein
MRANVVVEQLGRPALQLVLVALLLSVAGQRILALAWAFGYLPAALVSAWWWRRIRPRPPTMQGEVARPEHLTRTFWRFSGPRAIASVAQLTIQRFDIVLVGAMAGAVAAAVYAATTRFLVVGQMGNRAISLAVQPRLGEALGRHDLVATKHFYEISTAWLMLVTWPLYLMFVVFGQRLLTVFGRGYDAGNDVLLVLAITMLFATACGMVDMVLNMAGRTSWNLYNVLLSLVVQFGLDVLLIPHLGILGAAIGWAAAIAIGNLAALLQVGLSLRLHPFGAATALAALLGVACFLVVPTAIRFAVGDTWAAVAISALVGGAVYALLLWRLRRPLELTALREIRRRKAPSTG